MPLPHSFPDIAVLRQLIAHRGQDSGHTPIRLHNDTLYFHTDGSADTPLNTDTRRAAWSVIQFSSTSTTTPYLTIKIQHVAGPQSIARAELAAVTWNVQHAVTIATDSQYVINSITQITQSNHRPNWHRLAHALGNAWADQAAVRARQIDHPLCDTLVTQAQTWHTDQFSQTKAILAYLADLNLEHAQLKQQTSAQSVSPSSHDSTNDWGTIYRLRESHQIASSVITLQPTIHPAFVTACVWGNQYADLVLRFCASLKWPDPSVLQTDPTTTVGIT